jgi:hypothetical protein
MAVTASVRSIGRHGPMPMVLDNVWRVGDLVSFVKDGPEFVVMSVSWNHYPLRNHDCYIEIKEATTPIATR